jgi:hypothetical protein
MGWNSWDGSQATGFDCHKGMKLAITCWTIIVIGGSLALNICFPSAQTSASILLAFK